MMKSCIYETLVMERSGTNLNLTAPSSCLFTMYACRVTLVMPDLQCMLITVPPHPWIFGEEKQWQTTPGSLVFGFFWGWGLPQEELGGQGLAYQRCRGHRKWRVGRKISEPSSAVVCAKSSDIHICSQMEYEHDFLENFIRFYCTTLYFFPCNHVMP